MRMQFHERKNTPKDVIIRANISIKFSLHAMHMQYNFTVAFANRHTMDEESHRDYPLTGWQCIQATTTTTSFVRRRRKKERKSRYKRTIKSDKIIVSIFVLIDLFEYENFDSTLRCPTPYTEFIPFYLHYVGSVCAWWLFVSEFWRILNIVENDHYASQPNNESWGTVFFSVLQPLEC